VVPLQKALPVPNQNQVLIARVAWRNPFHLRRLPLIAQIYRDGFYFEDPTRLKNLYRLGLRKLFGVMHARGWAGEGVFDLETNGRSLPIRFSGLNTQFQSLYMRQVPNGTEPQIAALMDLLIADDGVFYDVGSNWGYYTLYVGSRPGFKGSIHAFEPMPTTFADLASCVKQAGLDGIATCHNLGVSSSGGSASMAIPDGVHSGTASLLGQPSASGTPVKLAALDEMGLPDPTFIKLDVENHETEALGGASAILGRAKPMIVFENWLQPDQPFKSLEPLRMLLAQGYRLFLPGWWISAGGGRLVTPGSDTPAAELNQIALIPLDLAQRYALSERQDFFACHEDRFPNLLAKFAPVDITSG